MSHLDLGAIDFHLSWRLKCHVKILMVTDTSSGGFGESAGFHLGQILKILNDDPWWHVQFDVTKAHRQTGEGADLTGFRFDAHDLAQYSQIWLFGIERTANALSPQELRALSEFMDAGGGVFATGDHENLGQAMCAEVPRVRSMRRWYHPSVGPNGEPLAPAQTGTERHDTVMNLSSGGDQSDNTPQPIRPRWYSRKTGGGIIYQVHRFPHPVLCGPNGVIEYLPDHMHEGLCEVPSDLSKSWTFSGYTCAEYPTVSGIQERPEVIAWATSRNTDGDEFGVIAAYNGHRANVGRVLVDATWHHWFNINLTGFINATTSTLPGGAPNPAYDPAVVPKWEAIKAYFRNVALWLAHPSLQNCLRNGGWILPLKYYDILITYRPIDQVKNRLEYFWQLGVFARDAMGRLASRCQTTRLIVDILEVIPFPFDPWPPFRKPPLPDPPPWLHLVDLENVALGGAIHELMTRFRDETNAQALFDRRGREVAGFARRGAAIAVSEMMKRYQTAGKEAERIDKLLRRQIKR